MHLHPTGFKICKNPISSLYTVRKAAGILAALTLLKICLVYCTRNSLITPRYSITQVLKDYSTQVFKCYLSQIVTYHGEIAHVTYLSQMATYHGKIAQKQAHSTKNVTQVLW